MKNRAKRYFVRVFAAAMAVSALIMQQGCSKTVRITTGLSDSVIFKLSNKECSTAEIMITLINEKNHYEKDFGAGIWEKSVKGVSMEESVKNSIKERQIYLDAMYIMAQDKSLELSDEEERAITESAKLYFDTLTDREKELSGASEKDIAVIYKKNFLAARLYENITKDVIYEVSDEEARVISVMYIYTSAGKDTDMARIKEAYGKLQSGADFYSLALEYSDESIIRLDIGRGDMVPEIEDKVFELSRDEYTDIIAANGGYYIVKCVDDYLKDMTDSNKEKILTDKKNAKFLEEFEPFMKKQRLDFNSKVWDGISLGDYSECTTDTMFDIYAQYVGVME